MLGAMKEILLKALRSWGRHATQDKAAALTYYALLSFPPIMLLLLQITKMVAISNQTPQQVVANISRAFPREASDVVSQFALRSFEATSIWVTLLSIVLLLWTASALVDALERAINAIFEVKVRVRRQNFKFFVQKKLLSLLSLLLFIIVLLLSFVLPGYFTLFAHGGLVTTLELLTTFGVLTLIFTFILRWLPYVVIPRREAWLSGAILALLTLIGKVALSALFGLISVGSDFAVGASIVLFLVWIYYSTSIILFGLEMIRAWLVVKDKITYKPYAVSARS